MTKYQKGDQGVFKTDSHLVVADNPFYMYAVRKGSKFTVIEVLEDTYTIEVHRFFVTLKASHHVLEKDTLKKLHIKDSYTRYSKVIESNLTFGQAIDKAIKEGKKVSRSIWGGYWYIETISYNGDKEQGDYYEKNHKHKVLMAKLKDGGFAIATPYQEDMFAQDWMVVE